MENGRYYHVYNHANGNENLFREPENYRWFLQRYDVYISPVAETYAYCLLPNHFHFLIRIKDSSTLLQTFPKFQTLEKLETAAIPGKQFSNLFSSYTQGFNKKYKRKGSLFLKNFKRKQVTSDDYFTRLVAYIHLNPVVHRFVVRPEHWAWSSYNSILSEQPTKLNRETILRWFGSKELYSSFHENYHSEKFPEINTLEQWFRLT